MGTILVTGGSGFVGRHLVPYLQGQGHNVLAPSRGELDLNRPESLSGLYFDHLIHLAAIVPSSTRELSPVSIMGTNVGGTQLMVNKCLEVGSGITFVSSVVYSTTNHGKVSESAEIQHRNAYISSKIFGEILCEEFSTRGLPRATVVRPFNLFGFGQGEGFLIPSLIKRLGEDGQSITLDNARAVRDFLYIEDFVELLELTISGSPGFNAVNAGSGTGRTIRSVLDSIQGLLGTSKNVVESPAKDRGSEISIWSDNSEAFARFGWEAQTEFQSGLRKVVSFNSLDKKQ